MSRPLFGSQVNTMSEWFKNMQRNWLDNALDYARRLGKNIDDAANAIQDAVDHPEDIPQKLLDSLHDLGELTAKLLKSECFRKKFFDDLGKHLASPKGIADAVSVTEGALAGRMMPEVFPGPKCFVAGTLVATESGLKSIEQIRVGEKVWSFNEQTGVIALKPVFSVSETTADLLVALQIGSETVVTTLEHPFWVDNFGWVTAGALEPGSRIKGHEGESLAVTKVEVIVASEKVFNFEVGEFHTYFVSKYEFLVHNGLPCPKVRTKWGPEHGKGNVAHNNAIEDTLDAAERRGATDMRKNRVQRDASGRRAFAPNGGHTRPDGSWIEEGIRHNYNRVSNLDDLERELDAFKTMRDADPNAVNFLEF